MPRREAVVKHLFRILREKALWYMLTGVMRKMKLLLLPVFFFWGVCLCLPAAAAAPAEPALHTDWLRRGDEPLAALRLELPVGSSAYAHDAGVGARPAVLALRDASGRPLPVLYPPGEPKTAPGLPNPVSSYVSGATFFVPLPADAASKELRGALSLVLCTAEQCFLHRLEIALRVPEGELPEVTQSPYAAAFAVAKPGRPALSEEKAEQGESLPILSLDRLAGNAAAGTPAVEAWKFTPRVFRSAPEVSGLWAALGLGLCAGLLLNVMPCVLPVLALKAGAFLRLSGEENRRRLREDMLLFAAGILAWFALLALVLGGADLVWGQLFQQPLFVYGLAALIFVLGLSLLGVFHLPLIDLKAGRGDSPRMQAFFGGFLATLLATPCGGPLLGGVLAWAFTQNAPALAAVFGAVGLGMALPYLIFALRPEAARFLPRSGPWLGALERLLGFFLMGLTVYLISLLPADRRMPALASLALIAPAAWIWGNYGAPASGRARAAALCAAGALFAVALFAGLRQSPPPAYWEEFAPREFRAALGREPLLLSFTADWCPNCKALELAVLTEERLAELRRLYGLRFIRVDLTREDESRLSLLRALGGSAIPFTAIFPAGADSGRPLVLRDLYSGGQLEEAARQTLGRGTRGE